MNSIATGFNRNKSTLKVRLEHWFRHGDLQPEQGIALLLGLDAEDVHLAALSDWGNDKFKDQQNSSISIVMLNGNKLQLPINAKSLYNKFSYGDSEITDEDGHGFDAVPESGYECSDAEVELFNASMEAEAAAFTAYLDKTEQDWIEILPNRFKSVFDKFEYFFREHKKWLGYWESDHYKHPAHLELPYFVAWAKSKDFIPEWQPVAVKLEMQRQMSWVNDDNVGEVQNIPDSDRHRLLKQIAALSLALAEKSTRYKRGEKPNASQIANVTVEILDALPDGNLNGVGTSSLRESIKSGLELLTTIKK